MTTFRSPSVCERIVGYALAGFVLAAVGGAVATLCLPVSRQVLQAATVAAPALLAAALVVAGAAAAFAARRR